MQALPFAATGDVAGRGTSVHLACKDVFHRQGPLHEYHLIHANGIQVQRATHEGPIQDLKLVTRSGSQIGKLKYKKFKFLGGRCLLLNVSPGFRFMTPHKQPRVRRARRLWRSRTQRLDTLNDRRWYRKIIQETEAHERCTLGNVKVARHQSAIAECSLCYAFTTVLGAVVKNWKETKKSKWVCQVCDSSVFLCHCGWCQAPLFFADTEDVNCRPQGVQSLLCCVDCSIHHYCNYTGG